MNQQSHYWAYILKKPYLKKSHVPQCSLFTITRTWKEPRRPLTDEWIKKLWYICTMEYYSAIKRNEFESIELMWMNLQLVIQMK